MRFEKNCEIALYVRTPAKWEKMSVIYEQFVKLDVYTKQYLLPF